MKLKFWIQHSILIGSLFSYSFAGIDFGNDDSAIKVRSGATMTVSLGLANVDGTIKKDAGAFITGEPIEFANGILESEGAEVLLTGQYIGETGIVNLRGNESFDAEPGLIVETVDVRGPNNRLEGQPLFSSDIVLNDPATELTVALQNKVNQNIVLNGGTLTLDDNLLFADDVRVTESGTVIFNGNQLSLGGADLVWSGTILWDHATDMELNSDVSVVGQWIFLGDAHVIGNGNTLDLTNGGTIWIKHDTTVDFSDIKIKGLGTGSIIFETETSNMKISQIEIEMNKHYTVTQGGIYADGPATIVVKDKLLTFAQEGSLTVDGIALIYDTLRFNDQLNIKPNIPDDLGQSCITYLNDGVIRRLPVIDALGDLNLYFDSFLTADFIASVLKRLIFVNSLELNGNYYKIIFTRDNIPLLLVNDGQNVVLTNIVIENFADKYIDLGLDSSLIFGNNTTLELSQNEDLSMTLTFQGACVINGHGNSLFFNPLGEIVVDQPGSSLVIEDVIIKGISADQIRCLDNTCTITFKNVTWMQADDFNFATGRFEVLGDFKLFGDSSFVYQTDRQSKINTDARMILDRNMTFSYEPTIADRDLLAMEDKTAVLFLNGASLSSSTTGLRLTQGTLIIDHKSFLRNDTAISLSEGISFGNNNIVPLDLNIEFMPGGSLNLLSGYLDYANFDA